MTMMTDKLLLDLEELFYGEPNSRIALKSQYERLKRALSTPQPSDAELIERVIEACARYLEQSANYKSERSPGRDINVALRRCADALRLSLDRSQFTERGENAQEEKK